MTFTVLDWLAIVGCLLMTVLLGLYFRHSSVKSTEDSFVSGRSASCWLAGTSMVATIFAADTPLVVTGLVCASSRRYATAVHWQHVSAASVPSVLACWMNCLILGWVTKAMISIVAVTMGPATQGGAWLTGFPQAAVTDLA